MEQLDANEQVPMVRDTNDFLQETVAKYPARFAGFASLSTAAPDQAAKELERMMQAGAKGAIINGHSRARYLDDKFFWPILESRRTPECANLPASDSASPSGRRRVLRGFLSRISRHSHGGMGLAHRDRGAQPAA